MEKLISAWNIRLVLSNTVFILGLLIFILTNKFPVENASPDLQFAEEKTEVVQKEEKIEPVFDVLPKIRNVSGLGKVLSDIESHMPEGHRYYNRDKITWAHETTHGIAGRIRLEDKDSVLINGFYCLEDRACVIYIPKTRCTKVASLVPLALRGRSFDLYMNKMARSWDDNSLYIFDEWVAYTNSYMCGAELKMSNLYYELLQAHNFNVYSICLAMLVKKDCPEYDDKQFKSFLMWNIERTYSFIETENADEILSDLIRERSKRTVHLEELKRNDPTIEENPLYYGNDKYPTANALEYAKKIREEPSAEDLRVFARNYFGAEWCKKIMGF